MHFLCFRSTHERLARDPRVAVWLSGGFALKQGDGTVRYSIEGFYDPFDVDPDRVLPFEAAREQEFDVIVCAHTSDALFPPSARRAVQIFHGVSFKNFAVREKVLRYDFLCVPGRYHAERFREQGLLGRRGCTALLTGFAKTDRLVAPGFDREGFLRRAGLDPSRPTLLYAPTGGKNNSLETMGIEVIRAIDRHGTWNLLIKPHDHPKRKIDWFGRLAGLENDRIRLVRDLDVVDYLRGADLLMTDASSVAVEYTLLDRPIVFLDVPKLLMNVVKRGAPLDLSTYGRKIGLLARSVDETVPAIERALRNPDEGGEIRRSMAAHVFHDPGGATERVTEAILHAAGLRPELPENIEVLTP